MPVSRCPRCDTQVQIDERDLGYDVECPMCRAVFPARPDTAEPPTVHRAGDRFDRPRYEPPRDEERPRRRDDDDYDYRNPREVIEDARRAVLMPALLSVIACVIALCYHGVDTAINLMNRQLLVNPLNGQPIPVEMYVTGKVVIALWQLIVIAGSFAMMRLRARGFCFTAMVMQIIPCAGPCCLFGLPVGIWGLVVLSRPEVREAFELVARGRVGPTADDYDEDEER
jgi:hypothetical protein